MLNAVDVNNILFRTGAFIKKHGSIRKIKNMNDKRNFKKIAISA